MRRHWGVHRRSGSAAGPRPGPSQSPAAAGGARPPGLPQRSPLAINKAKICLNDERTMKSQFKPRANKIASSKGKRTRRDARPQAWRFSSAISSRARTRTSSTCNSRWRRTTANASPSSDTSAGPPAGGLLLESQTGTTYPARGCHRPKRPFPWTHVVLMPGCQRLLSAGLRRQLPPGGAFHLNCHPLWQLPLV